MASLAALRVAGETRGGPGGADCRVGGGRERRAGRPCPDPSPVRRAAPPTGDDRRPVTPLHESEPPPDEQRLVGAGRGGKMLPARGNAERETPNEVLPRQAMR